MEPPVFAELELAKNLEKKDQSSYQLAICTDSEFGDDRYRLNGEPDDFEVLLAKLLLQFEFSSTLAVIEAELMACTL